MTPHLQYLQWAEYGVFGIAVLRQLSLLILRLVAVFTSSDKISMRSFEVLRLSRRDASSIPTYLTASPNGNIKSSPSLTLPAEGESAEAPNPLPLTHKQSLHSTASASNQALRTH